MGHFISFTVTFGGFKVNKIIAVRDLCPVHQNIVPVLHAGLVDPLLAVRTLLVYLAVQFIENQFIYPRVVGKSVGLSPLYTLVAAMIGGKLFGIPLLHPADGGGAGAGEGRRLPPPAHQGDAAITKQTAAPQTFFKVCGAAVLWGYFTCTVMVRSLPGSRG